jgi:NAD(P)-dependent dehydrogenase (short-subunit alcohol dehydrogenase family)
MDTMVNDTLRRLFSLEGKVALVTGAAGGIFSAVARGMAAAGCEMALCDVDGAGLMPVENAISGDGGRAYSVSLDLLSADSVKSCVDTVIERSGRIDVLVNGAGINRRVPVLEGDAETFDRIMAVNLKGAYILSQEVAKHMIRQGGGSIINVTSYNAFMMLGGCFVYGASKSGVAALTRAQAIEWAKYGIRANAIAPGHIRTPLTEPTWTNPSRSKYLLDRIAMARPGMPEDLLGMTILLASDASGYMTGQTYVVDGGCLAGGQPWDIS